MAARGKWPFITAFFEVAAHFAPKISGYVTEG